MVNKHYGPLLSTGSIKAAGAGMATMDGSSPYVPQLKAGTGFGHGLKRALHFKWDFSIDGGAISTITLSPNGYPLPANTIISNVILNPVAAPVGVGASVAFGITGATSPTTCLKGITAITSFTVDLLLAGTPVGTAATSFKLATLGNVTMTISGAALTAGIIEGWVEYFEAANA
jgi:hypothetical protein